MKLNQYAVYRVDQTSSGKALWRLPYDMVQKKKLQIRIEFYRQQRIEKISVDDTDLELGDIVGGRERITNIYMAAPVIRKIVDVTGRGRTSISYKLKGEE